MNKRQFLGVLFGGGMSAMLAAAAFAELQSDDRSAFDGGMDVILKGRTALASKHKRDTIIIDGRVEQDYRFLTYRFAAPDGEIEARVYLDYIWAVSITAPIDLPSLPADLMAYLQMRFRLIKQLGGPDGYRSIWQAATQPR